MADLNLEVSSPNPSLAVFPLFLKSQLSVDFSGERDGWVSFRVHEQDFDLFEKFNCPSVDSG